MFRHKVEKTFITVKKPPVIQLPLIFPDSSDFSQPQPGYIDQKHGQGHCEKICKIDADHFSPALVCQFIIYTPEAIPEFFSNAST